MFQNKSEIEAREEILDLVKIYYSTYHEKQRGFEVGDRVNYAGRIYDEKELLNLVDSGLEFWLTSGRYTSQFEKKLAQFLNIKYCYTCNSGSSANLLAFMALTSPLLGERAIQRNDEIITVAAGFPTTVAPIIQYGAIPVFVDITLPQYNIDCSQIERAITGKTKGIMLAHTLGNPFDIQKIKEICDQNKLWLIEDNCDALGSQVYLDGQWQYTGTIGHIGTSSFYPPHHMTMGEGGAVYTNDPLLAKILLSLRDWGRDCSCPSGIDNRCGNRFNGQFGQLPYGYDHKYVYSHFGYNLKITDMQAAIGCAQLEKLEGFIEARIKNWNYLRNELDSFRDVFILPEVEEKTKPSWFGFLIGVRETAAFTRDEIVKYLEEKKIQTRMLFAGNLILHPCFDQMRHEGKEYRQIGDLKLTNFAMERSFWIGVYPGMTEEKLAYMVQCIKEFINL